MVEVLGRRVDPTPEPIASGLLEVLRGVPDRRGRRYPLWGLLAAAILATAAVMRSIAGIPTWVRTAPEAVLAVLGLRASEKTLRVLFAGLDAADLDQRLGAYFSTLTGVMSAEDPVAVALEGKTLRGARIAGDRAPHLVSVSTHRARLVLGQLAVAAKSNEIPAARKLLRSLAMTGVLMTMDAMHIQVATARLICGRLKSHFLAHGARPEDRLNSPFDPLTRCQATRTVPGCVITLPGPNDPMRSWLVKPDATERPDFTTLLAITLAAAHSLPRVR